MSDFKMDEMLELLYKIDSRLDVIEKYLHFEDEEVANILDEIMQEEENIKNSKPGLVIVKNDQTVVDFPKRD
jgi:hypothetical protein